MECGQDPKMTTKQDQRSTAPPLVSVIQLGHQSANQSVIQPIG